MSTDWKWHNNPNYNDPHGRDGCLSAFLALPFVAVKALFRRLR